jgi:hypothetical protein
MRPACFRPAVRHLVARRSRNRHCQGQEVSADHVEDARRYRPIPFQKAG